MKSRIFSGIQPTGRPHLGNYIGAMAQWVRMQDTHDCIFSIVDLHAITVPQDSKELHSNILKMAKIYLAAGIDPDKSSIFVQSHIKEHVELTWILNCAVARMSDLNKMTQFKDKAEGKKNVSVGLFDYPVLMAADILLYDIDVVPVGEDQKQHVELARDLAKRFNHDYGEVFKIPEVKIRKTGARLMSLDDPTKKMSKSSKNENSFLALLDEPSVARKKIMRAVTDTGDKVEFDLKKKPGISNLLTIYAALSGKKVSDVVEMYEDALYGDFKRGLADEADKFLTEFQEKYNDISDHHAQMILADGLTRVQPIAEKTIRNVKKKMGIN